MQDIAASECSRWFGLTFVLRISYIVLRDSYLVSGEAYLGRKKNSKFKARNSKQYQNANFQKQIMVGKARPTELYDSIGWITFKRDFPNTFYFLAQLHR